jgi:hypothetical protein|uniref:Uncharacterized protein n=1 Tax=viral metagenome TaxID=1070528 RepID=A0A6C0JB24_9ZZZZ
MVSIVIVDKQGCLKNVKVKDVTTQSLAKKCNFKNADDFAEMCIWDMSDRDIKIHLFAKLFGRANCENKYDFPPPVDEMLFFGSCALVKYDTKNGSWSDLDVSEWKSIYEDLFGGFEDLGSETSSEDELENVPDEYKTEDGYLIDDFVVNDNDEIAVHPDGGTESDEYCDEISDDNNNDELFEDDFIFSDEEI